MKSLAFLSVLLSLTSTNLMAASATNDASVTTDDISNEPRWGFHEIKKHFLNPTNQGGTIREDAKTTFGSLPSKTQARILYDLTEAKDKNGKRVDAPAAAAYKRLLDYLKATDDASISRGARRWNFSQFKTQFLKGGHGSQSLVTDVVSKFQAFPDADKVSLCLYVRMKIAGFGKKPLDKTLIPVYQEALELFEALLPTPAKESLRSGTDFKYFENPRRPGTDYTHVEYGRAQHLLQGTSNRTPEGYVTALSEVFSPERAEKLLNDIAEGESHAVDEDEKDSSGTAAASATSSSSSSSSAAATGTTAKKD